MTTDVFTHPWLSGHFGEDEVAAHLDAACVLTRMIAVESAFTAALGKCGVVGTDIANAAIQILDGLNIAPKDLRSGTGMDGLPIPALVGLIKAAMPTELHPAIHKGLTSQDVMDTAFILTVRRVVDIFENRLVALIDALETLEAAQGDNRLMGRTRMQAALDMRVGERVRTWHAPLSRHLDRLAELKPRLLLLQLGGPVGDRAGLGDHADGIANHMALTLDLGLAPSWHSMRDAIAEFASWLSLVSGSLGKMGQDIALMAQQGIDEAALQGGGSSSAMPHKQNPIRAELLVTLAQFNATQLAGMHHALVHEQERSGAAWSLEWMLLPPMMQATGRSLTAATELCAQITRLGSSGNPATSE